MVQVREDRAEFKNVLLPWGICRWGEVAYFIYDKSQQTLCDDHLKQHSAGLVLLASSLFQ